MATNASFPVNGFVQGKKQGWQRQVACMGKAIIAAAVVDRRWNGLLVEFYVTKNEGISVNWPHVSATAKSSTASWVMANRIGSCP